jgi:rsbT co-antagonist protein RsbR
VGIDRALRGEDGARVYSDYRDPPTQVAGVYRWIPALEAGLLAEIGREEVLATSARSVLISGAIALGASLVALLFGLFVAAQIARPILQLTRMVAHISDGNLDERVALGQRNELGLLAAGFNSMADRLRETLQGLERRIADSTAELRNALGERERTLSELRESFDARDQLQETIRGMSSPVLPVLEGVLVMPIIGVVDSARAAMLTGALLQAIEHHRAKVVILDVTGVPIIDTQVARVLIQAADATRLLGAEPVLVGIRPELAHTIVGLGLDLSSLVAQADLQSGIRYAATRRSRGEQARPLVGKQ